MSEIEKELKPNYEHQQLLLYAVQVYLSHQGLSYLDMHRLSWERNKHTKQQQINQHLFDACFMMRTEDVKDSAKPRDGNASQEPPAGGQSSGHGPA